jgi:hypothetical protein
MATDGEQSGSFLFRVFSYKINMIGQQAVRQNPGVNRRPLGGFHI